MRGIDDRFAELVSRPEADIPLDECALLIAAQAYPALDPGRELARLDHLAESCPVPTLDGLREHLFDKLGFTGNGVRYDDPRNSFLNEVIDRRVGIPISLSVLTMEVGRRLGVALEGVGMPGHFLVRHTAEPPVLLDPFNGGRISDVDGAQSLFQQLHGDTVGFTPDLLAAARPRAILARMLTNLRQLYERNGDATSTGWVLRMRAAIPVANIHEQADVAGVQALLGRFDEAADTLDEIAERLPDNQASRARAEASLLRSRLN